MEFPLFSAVKIPEEDTTPFVFGKGFFAELDEPG